ncbi:hypothetical protein MGMO_188c00010 [Methyloglobulus morosus KoM1]|uniref:Uncharacterized protein n=1 Tax=Methyloglobulus morosus KoM1 TaxID=1116472 RepID=V5BK03_9GAMM|nr:hypothetical protein MGMO_188c00010 [Methyloglobulus morosus KoM1]
MFAAIGRTTFWTIHISLYPYKLGKCSKCYTNLTIPLKVRRGGLRRWQIFFAQDYGIRTGPYSFCSLQPVDSVMVRPLSRYPFFYFSPRQFGRHKKAELPTATITMSPLAVRLSILGSATFRPYLTIGLALFIMIFFLFFSYLRLGVITSRKP